ncbi:hypothetical protein ACQ88U_37790 [Streptomyces lividans]
MVCDVCQQAIAEGRRNAVCGAGLVGGLAMTWHDGLRLVTACSQEHLDVLRQRYARRPFIEEELWIGKIAGCSTSILTGSEPTGWLRLPG